MARVNGLAVDPGSKASLTQKFLQRLFIAFSLSSSDIFSNASVVYHGVRSLGLFRSKFGYEASARISPLFGSIMITAVFLLPSSSSRSSPLCASLNSRIYFSTMLCSVTSIVDTTVFPFFAAFTVRSTEEALSKYPYSLPSVPLRISLYALSMPIAP